MKKILNSVFRLYVGRRIPFASTCLFGRQVAILSGAKRNKTLPRTSTSICSRGRFATLGMIIIIYLLPISYSLAQNEERDLIQFSGVVVTGDSLSPVPFVNIIIKNSFRGTISDYFGYFSFVAQEYDTIVFSAVGFKKGRFIIPDSLSTNRYSLIQLLIKDTFLLQETIIYPWPTIEQFKQAFMNLNIPDDDLERAKNNLVMAELKERAEETGMDGSMNFTNYMQQQNSKLYYAGQYPPNNILNPLAWAQFIQAWRNGDFKRQK